ncbi:hypothetical protein Tco_1405399 [Tanacetum coccineum]
MATPTIFVPAEENLGDPIDIRVDIIHPEPVVAVAFPAATVVRTQAQHEEAIRGILEHLQGVPIEEEMSTLRFRMGYGASRRIFPLEVRLRPWRLSRRKDHAHAESFAWKGVVRFGKRGKLNPRNVGPFKVLEKVGAVAYKLDLPQDLSRVHNMFHVSNLKKCYADEPLAVQLDGLHVDDKLRFVEELVEIMDREVKWLRQSRVPIVKV